MSFKATKKVNGFPPLIRRDTWGMDIIMMTIPARVINPLLIRANIKNGGEYDVQVSYTDGPNRSNKTPITVMHADGEQKIYIDQTKPPAILKTFTSVGVFRFERSNGM